MTIDEAIAFCDLHIYNKEIIKNENIRDGKWVVYIDSSITPAIFFELKNGKLNGDYVRFYGNGSIDIYRFFNDDKYINYIATWKEDGNLGIIDDYLQTYKDRRLNLNKRQRIESVINFYGENSGTREYKRPRCLPIKYWHLRRGCKWKW
ncbi:MAG: hypothetical protein BroJett020_02260 [Bacteroidota bacterium]|nr:MAG: hypothetical protein BroJett020_02260 [Bacteroidota bacterium]